jgi:hypothetical protein
MTESRTDEALVNRLRMLYQIARDHKRLNYNRWIRNYRLVNNKIASSGPSWMPAPRDSEIYPVLSSLVAWMTDQQIGIETIPAADPNSGSYNFYNNIAADLTSILHTTWQTEGYRSQIKLALWDAFMYGSGILKNVWDQSLSGGHGNAILRRTDPWAFYPDPYATSMDDMEYCVEVRRMSLDEIERRWPHARTWLEAKGASGDVIDERPDINSPVSSQPKANPGSLPNATTIWGGSNPATKLYEPLPSYIVYEFWIRENKTWYEDAPTNDDPSYAEAHCEDEWRVICVCNGEVLMNERAGDLWPHGQHPYERYVFDDIGEFYGIALVDHLAEPQVYINRLLTAVQHNLELTGNPVLVEGAQSGTDRIGIVNRPGQRLTVRGPGGMVNNKPEWLNPPQLPTELVPLIQFWISRIENISGLSAMQKGATPNQRNAAEVINNVQEAAFVRIRAGLQNLEDTLQRCGVKLTELIVDNYTEPRIVAIVGPDGATTSKALAARHFHVPTSKGATPLKYTLIIQSGATTPTSRQTRLAEAQQMAALGLVDDEYVLQVARVPRYKEVLDRLYYKRSQGLIGVPGARQRQGRS